MNSHRQSGRIERLEQERAELIRRLEAWPREWLTHKPGPAEWSALEVLDHLRKTELAVTHSVERNLESREHRVTRSERARAAALLLMMRLPIKLKVPEPVSFVRPDPSTSLETVLHSWQATSFQLKELVETFGTDAEDVGLVFHPAAGWMDVRAALSFLLVHLHHHQFQFQKIKGACEQANLISP